MFSLARLIRLWRPMPPTPTPAMFSLSLGGVNPRPSTCLGTMENAAPPTATFVRNLRRVISFFSLMSFSPAAPTISRSTGLVQILSWSLGRIGLQEDVVPGCGHRDVAHAIPPEEPVEKGGVHGVGTTEVKGLAFFPFLGVHLINEAVVAVAIVGGERGLLPGAVEEGGPDCGPRIVGVHRRDAQERFDRANHVDRRIEGMIDERSSSPIGLRCWQRGVLADDERDAAVRVNMVGTILCIILKNEESGIVPIRAVRNRVNDASDSEVIVGDRRGRAGQSFFAPRRVGLAQT